MFDWQMVLKWMNRCSTRLKSHIIGELNWSKIKALNLVFLDLNGVVMALDGSLANFLGQQLVFCTEVSQGFSIGSLT